MTEGGDGKAKKQAGDDGRAGAMEAISTKYRLELCGGDIP